MPILAIVGAARRRAADHVVQRRAQFPGDGAADRAGRPGLEPARRLWRPVFVRTCGVLRHRRLCHRDPANALRHQRMAGIALGIAAGALVGAVTGALSFARGSRAPILRSSLWPSPKCCGSSPASRPSPARASARSSSSICSRKRSSSRAGRHFTGSFSRWSALVAGPHSHDRAQPVRRLSHRRARERGRREGARRRMHHGQARRDDDLGRHRRGRRLLLCAVFPVHRCRHRLRPVDFGRGAARSDYWRDRHRVRSIARRSGGQDTGRTDQAHDRRRAGPRSCHLWRRARSGRCVCAARHCRHLRRSASPPGVIAGAGPPSPERRHG